MFARKDKGLIEDAYSDNVLKIGNSGDDICICGTYWAIRIKKGCITQKKLESISGLIGEIARPQTGVKFIRSRNPYEPTEEFLLDIMENIKACGKRANVTALTIDTPAGVKLRVIQEPIGGKIYLIQERFIEMLDRECIEQGPLVGHIPVMLWRNSVMELLIMCYKTKEKELVDHLEQITLPKTNKEWDE